MTENMAKIQFALENGMYVHNGDGQKIVLPKNWDYEFGQGKHEDDVKVYVDGTHWFWSSAENQQIFVNAVEFDVWLERQPLELVH